MSTFIKVTVGRAGTAGDHTRYITRERATERQPERVWTRNVPEYADRGESYKERVSNLREYARQLEEDELARPQPGGVKNRTHYRAVYSFDRQVSDATAREMVNRHLEENFPKARTVAAIHRDTDNAHVHVQIAARQVDGRKVQLGRRQYRSLDERWARIYGREFGREVEREHMAKKNEWRAYMRERRAAKERGEELPPRPKRVERTRNQAEERRRMAARQYGLEHANETGTRGDQRRATHGERGAATREQRADRAASGARREAASDRPAAGEVSRRAAAGEREHEQRRQPGRVRRADRAAGRGPQEHDRSGAGAGQRASQTRAATAGAPRPKRADESGVSNQHRRDQPGDAPAQAVSERTKPTADRDAAQDRRGDVRQHDLSGSFDRVLRLMETVTDQARDRGRDQVAGLNRGDAVGAGAAARTGDREQALPAGTERATRATDLGRERSAAAGGEQRAIARAHSGADQAGSQGTQPQVREGERDEARQRINAGRWRAQYLVELVKIGLQERETGQNAYEERQHLQLTMYQMREAERLHEQQYGGRPRPILTKEERDYLTEHREAPRDGWTREEITKELAQAYVIGEARRGESLERQVERQPERERDRGREFSR